MSYTPRTSKVIANCLPFLKEFGYAKSDVADIVRTCNHDETAIELKINEVLDGQRWLTVGVKKPVTKTDRKSIKPTEQNNRYNRQSGDRHPADRHSADRQATDRQAIDGHDRDLKFSKKSSYKSGPKPVREVATKELATKETVSKEAVNTKEVAVSPASAAPVLTNPVTAKTETKPINKAPISWAAKARGVKPVDEVKPQVIEIEAAPVAAAAPPAAAPSAAAEPIKIVDAAVEIAPRVATPVVIPAIAVPPVVLEETIVVPEVEDVPRRNKITVTTEQVCLPPEAAMSAPIEHVNSNAQVIEHVNAPPPKRTVELPSYIRTEMPPYGMPAKQPEYWRDYNAHYMYAPPPESFYFPAYKTYEEEMYMQYNQRMVQPMQPPMHSMPPMGQAPTSTGAPSQAPMHTSHANVQSAVNHTGMNMNSHAGMMPMHTSAMHMHAAPGYGNYQPQANMHSGMHSGMQQSGMHSGMQHSGMQHSGMQPSGMQPSGMQHSGMQHSGMQHNGMQNNMQNQMQNGMQQESRRTNYNNMYAGRFVDQPRF